MLNILYFNLLLIHTLAYIMTGLYIPSNPAFSNILTGYHIMGLFAMGNRAFGVELVRSVIRDPLPAAKITAWNSILTVAKVFLVTQCTIFLIFGEIGGMLLFKLMQICYF